MSLYKCEYCNYLTKIKANYQRHEKSKKHRNKLVELGLISKETDHMNQNEPGTNQNEPQMNQNEPTKYTKMNQNEPAMNQESYKCQFCESRFNTQASCRRHEIHRCKENPDFIDKIIDAKNVKIKTLQKDREKWQKEKETWQKEKEEWKKEKEKLYEQVSTLLDKVGDTNIQQNNIILNNYGAEDLSHITDALKNDLLKIPYGAIPKMIEAIHFNDEKPENKNIMLPNKKENLVKVFQDNKWVYKNKIETISDLVDSKYTIIDEHYDEAEKNKIITPSVQTSFKKFRKFYEKGDAEMVEKLKKECELVLLNNR